MRPIAQLRHLRMQAGKVEAISLRAITSTLGENSFALLLLLCAVLSIALTPIPGQATVLCIPMTLLAWQWLTGRRTIALPTRVAAQTIPAHHFRNGLIKVLPALVWLNRFCRKRMPEVLTVRILAVNRTTLLLLCLTLLIPIPFTHILPDIAIVLMTLGELEDDGLMILAGLLLGVLILCAFIVVGMLVMGGLL